MNGIWNDPNTGKLNASGRERDETRSLLASADDELENLSSSRHVAIGQGVGNWSVSRTATTSTLRYFRGSFGVLRPRTHLILSRQYPPAGMRG